ncbi:MAG: hypothetical protein CMJ77_06020 [Planctomycetaceae bacterium]|nr:hypothetical protein [Planctomycetaceae bacterium]
MRYDSKSQAVTSDEREILQEMPAFHQFNADRQDFQHFLTDKSSQILLNSQVYPIQPTVRNALEHIEFAFVTFCYEKGKCSRPAQDN